MTNWGTRRRNFIITIVLMTIIIIVGIFGYTFFYQEPTCFDGVRNGLEVGIDCGGDCRLICADRSLEPLVKWNRFFEVAPGVYNTVAYLENQNTDSGTEMLKYRITLFDDKNVILAEREGFTKIWPREVIPIFEGSFVTNQSIATRMTFELTNLAELEWVKIKPKESIISILNQKLTNVEASPRVSATVKNIGYSDLPHLKLVAILYNSEGNAVGASSTFIEYLKENQEVDVLFSWPQDFKENVARSEIFSIYDQEKLID